MNDESSFLEMMNRYNRELMRIQRQKPGGVQEREAENGLAPEPALPVWPSREETPREADAPRGSCAQDRETDHSQTVGKTGPVALQDTILHERLEIFTHHKLLERAVHVKGYGAFGYFQLTRSMEDYTKAAFLQVPGSRTRTFTRFSLAGSMRASPDTSRDIRGFSTKFYADGGVCDLLCNHIPVFLIEDCMLFPEAIAALSPSPVTNLPDPELFWSFVARRPETLHALTWLYSDFGTLDSFRFMGASSVNTFVWCNKKGERRYVKYHWLPQAGVRMLDRAQAVRLAGENPNIAGQDLHDTLAKGETVEYSLHVQLMEPSEAEALPYNPLDDTKYWSEEQFPLIPVGKLVLERNPEDYRAQVEQVAFSPSNLVEGVELSSDKMLQGRSFIYWDAQRRRLGPDFRSLPANHVPGWSPDKLVTSGEGLHVCGDLLRARSGEDDYTQAGEHYRSLSQEQQEHLVGNIAVELPLVSRKVRECVLAYFDRCDPDFGKAVRESLPRA